MDARRRTEKKNERVSHGRVQKNRRRAFARDLRRGSLTAEAALALPLFFFCVVTLIGFLEMYRLSMVHTLRLQQEAETLGQAAAVTGTLTEEIDLCESIPWNSGMPFFRASAGIACRARVRAWTGRGAEENTGGAQDGDRLVYVTEHRSVYHTDAACTHLVLQVRAVERDRVAALRNDYGEKYHACEKCARGQGGNTVVYITPEGDHYHCDADCGGLTRTVRMERYAEVGDLCCCSRCAEKEAA